MHLTPEQIERFADERLAPTPEGAPAEHLATCARCQEEVGFLRTLIARLNTLAEDEPALSPAFSETVLSRVDLQVTDLDGALEGLQRLSPTSGFAERVMTRVDLPHEELDGAPERLPTWSPNPGFASGVLARVRLPVPWPARVQRFRKRWQTAIATSAAATVAVSGGAAGWLFAAQGIAPNQAIGFVLDGVRSLLVDTALAAGRVGYRFGLVDAGGSIVDQVNPTLALGGLALVASVGVASLWAMARLFRAQHQPIELRKAA